MVSFLTERLTALASSIPLEVFALVGSFLEEVIAPIPSPGVLVVTGSLAALQGYAPYGLIHLVLLACVGKVVGAYVVYLIADYAEDYIMRVFGRFIDVTHEDIERFGERFAHSWKDYIVFIILRSAPIIPSVIISFGSGVLKLPLRLFLIGTFVGTIIRDTIYIAVGYSGTEFMRSLLDRSVATEDIVEGVAIMSIVTLIGYLVYRKRRRVHTP